MIKNKKVALVYDRVNKWGGAERVLLALHDMFPQAPLFTSVYNPKKAPWAKVFTVKTSWLQKLPFASSSHEFFPFFMPLAFESFSFDDYDIVISVSSEAAKGVVTKPHTVHINYCLTPTRYLWSGYTDYFPNPFLRFLSFPIVSYLRFWDKIAAQRADYVIAISKEVQKRIKQYYKREATVVYPAATFTIQENQQQKTVSSTKTKRPLQPGYFLVVSRLVAYKRIDIAIEACNRLQLPLVVVGTGSEEAALKELAGPTITFKRALTDRQLVEYYKGCRALLFPGIEDFGLVIVEAQRFGKPVIAFKGGGAKETVLDGKTGVFFTPQNVDALTSVLQTFDPTQYKAEDCRRQAEKFSEKEFKKHLTQVIEQYLANTV